MAGNGVLSLSDSLLRFCSAPLRSDIFGWIFAVYVLLVTFMDEYIVQHRIH